MKESRTSSWTGRHKRIAFGIVVLIIVGAIGLGIAYNNPTLTPIQTPDYRPDCIKQGNYTEYEGIKICEPKELQENATRALKELKKYLPEDFNFVKQYVKVILTDDNEECGDGYACAFPGDERGRVWIDLEGIHMVDGCSFVHEGEHLEGHYDEKIPDKHEGECRGRLGQLKADEASL
jgi:hypothetical protein